MKLFLKKFTISQHHHINLTLKSIWILINSKLNKLLCGCHLMIHLMWHLHFRFSRIIFLLSVVLFCCTQKRAPFWFEFWTEKFVETLHEHSSIRKLLNLSWQGDSSKKRLVKFNEFQINLKLTTKIKEQQKHVWDKKHVFGSEG